MKRIGILVFLCLWLPVLAGCGGNGGTSQPPQNSLIMDAAFPSGGPSRLRARGCKYQAMAGKPSCHHPLSHWNQLDRRYCL